MIHSKTPDPRHQNRRDRSSRGHGDSIRIGRGIRRRSTRRKRRALFEHLEARHLLAREVSGILAADETWSGTIHVVGDLTVDSGVELSIDPGTVVKVDPGRYIDVNGTLNATGTASQKIVFTSVQDDAVGEDLTTGEGSPFAGIWESLYLNDGDSGVSLRHVEIQYAGDIDANGVGGGAVPSLVLGKDATVLDSVGVSDSFGDGIAVDNDPSLSNVSVVRARNAVTQTLLADPTYSGLSASDNAVNAVVVSGGVLTEDRDWDFGSLPAHLTTDLYIGETADQQPVTLSVTPGSVIKFPQGRLVYAREGMLHAIGTAAKPVVLTALTDDSIGGDSNGDGEATQPYPGYWESVYLDGSDNILQHVEVRFAGDTNGDGIGGGATPAVVLSHPDTETGASPRLENVRISDGYSSGVSVTQGEPVLSTVHVENGDDAPFYFDIDSAPVVNGLTARGNRAGDGIVIQHGTLTEDRTWDYGGLPLIVTNGDFVVGSDTEGNAATLTIAPGTIVKVNQANYFYSNAGTLRAIGTAAEPIVFTAESDDTVGGDSNGDGAASEPYPGYWESIYLEGPNNRLEHVEVRYAGDTNGDGIGGGAVGAIQVNYAGGIAEEEIELINVRVSDGYSNGVNVLSGRPVLTDVYVEDGLGVPFYFDIDTAPIASGLNAQGNEAGDQIKIQHGTLAEDRNWNYGTLPLVITPGDVVIASDVDGNPATLSVAPGTIVKVSRGNYISATSGRLNATGTPADPIVFTAEVDDSVGGDSNGDGVESLPHPGFWESIYLYGPGNVLQNVQVRYAGDTNGDGIGAGGVSAVTIDHAGAEDDTQARLSDVSVRQSFSTGINVLSGRPILSNVAADNGLTFPYYFDIDASPSVSGLTAQGNEGGDRIVIQHGTLTEDRTWDYGSLPLDITTGSFVIGSDQDSNPATLTIAAGTTVKVSLGQYFQASTGSLHAEGTAQAPILFTADSDDSRGGDSNGDGFASSAYPGYWQAIYLDGPDNHLEHVGIRFAGDTNGDGIGAGRTYSLHARNDVMLDQVSIESAFGGGLLVTGGSEVTYTDGQLVASDVSSTTSSAIYVEQGSLNASGLDIVGSLVGVTVADGQAATVSDSRFVNNTTAVLHQGMDRANADFQNNWWGDAAGPDDPSADDGFININPAGQPVSDFVNYGSFLTVPPARGLGPKALSAERHFELEAIVPHLYAAEFNAEDTAGTRNGTTVGDTAYAAGRSGGQAFLLDGDGDYVDLGNWGPSSEWTIAAWVNPSDVPTSGRIGIAGGDSSGRDWSIGIRDGNFVANYKNNLFLDSGVAATVGVWTHVAATLRGNMLHVYTDGAIRASVDTGSVYVPTTSGIRIGSTSFNNGGFFNGLIDQISIAEFAADDAEITALYEGDPLPTRPAKDRIRVTFDSSIDLGSFDTDDITLAGPSVVSVESVDAAGDRIFLITLSGVLNAGGDHVVSIGPDIASVSGIAMDQDGDGNPGELTDDVFQAVITNDVTGPRIVTQTPSGTTGSVLTSIAVTLDEPIDVESFSPGAIELLDPAMVAARDAFDPSEIFDGFAVRATASRSSFSNVQGALDVLADRSEQARRAIRDRSLDQLRSVVGRVCRRSLASGRSAQHRRQLFGDGSHRDAFHPDGG